MCCVGRFAFFLLAKIPGSAKHIEIWSKEKTMRTRHATRPPAVPMVEGAAEAGGGGDLTDGPLDGQANRG